MVREKKEKKGFDTFRRKGEISFSGATFYDLPTDDDDDVEHKLPFVVWTMWWACCQHHHHKMC